MRTIVCPTCLGSSAVSYAKCGTCGNIGYVHFHDTWTGPESMNKDVIEIKQPFDYDKVYHPQHYTSHPSGIECKDITGDMPFFIGSAMKYLCRYDQKYSDPIEDLEKAKQYITFEIERRKKQKT